MKKSVGSAKYGEPKCLCHMLGKGLMKKKLAMRGGANGEDVPEYMKNLLLAYENQDNKPDKYTGYTMEELALMPPAERRRIKKEAERKRYDEKLGMATEEALKKIRGRGRKCAGVRSAGVKSGGIDKSKVSLLKDKFKSINKQHEEIKRKQEEEDKKLAKEESGDWLDDLFDMATEGVIDLTSKGLSQFGVPEKLTKGALKGLKSKLEGMGKKEKKPRKVGVRSPAQLKYQDDLKKIREKYNLSFKDTLKKYKELKNKNKL